MEREMTEVIASQKKMLERQGENGAGLSDEEMTSNFQEHLKKLQDWLLKQPSVDVLYVIYNDVITGPFENARRVNAFLGNGLNVEKMASVVEESLYRQRNN